MYRIILFILLLLILLIVPSSYSNAMTSDQSLMFSLINEERAKHDSPPVEWDERLAEQALIKSRDMHDNHYFDHISPNLGSPFEQLQSASISYKWAGENIAKARTYSIEEVMGLFMNSPDHKANIVSAGYTHVGIGIHNGYYTQLFMKPR